MRSSFSLNLSVLRKLFVVSLSVLMGLSFVGLAQSGTAQDTADVTWGINSCNVSVTANSADLGTVEDANVGDTLDGTGNVNTEGFCPYQVQVKAISATGPDGNLVGASEILTEGGIFKWKVNSTDILGDEGEVIDIQDSETGFDGGLNQSKTVGKVKWGGNVDWTMGYSYEIDLDDRVGNYTVTLQYTVTSASTGGYAD